MRCAGPVLRHGYFGWAPIGEGPEARCHNVTFVSGSEPPQASVQAGTVTGCALNGELANHEAGNRRGSS